MDHWVKSVRFRVVQVRIFRIWTDYEPENPRIRALFTQFISLASKLTGLHVMGILLHGMR